MATKCQPHRAHRKPHPSSFRRRPESRTHATVQLRRPEPPLRVRRLIAVLGTGLRRYEGWGAGMGHAGLSDACPASGWRARNRAVMVLASVMLPSSTAARLLRSSSRRSRETRPRRASDLRSADRARRRSRSARRVADARMHHAEVLPVPGAVAGLFEQFALGAGERVSSGSSLPAGSSRKTSPTG